MYIGYLIHLHGEQRKWFESAPQMASFLGCSESIAAFLISRFRQEMRSAVSGKPSRFTSSKATQVALLCYICILCLRLCNFQVTKRSLDALQEDLKIDYVLLDTHFRSVGAFTKKVKEDGHVVVSLTAPLKLLSQTKKFTRGVPTDFSPVMMISPKLRPISSRYSPLMPHNPPESNHSYS